MYVKEVLLDFRLAHAYIKCMRDTSRYAVILLS